MTDPEQELETFARVRANLSGQDSVFWWTGNVHAQIPGERATQWRHSRDVGLSQVNFGGHFKLSH